MPSNAAIGAGGVCIPSWSWSVRTKQFSLGRRSQFPSSVARPLLPFNFRKCCGCVASIVVVEQLPMRPFRCGRLVGGSPDRLALLVRRPDVRQQGREITPLVAERGRPVAHRPVTRHDALRRNLSSSPSVPSQPRMLPSITGIWRRKTRSPANSVLSVSSNTVRSLSLCPAGQARKVRRRDPRSSCQGINDEQGGRHDLHGIDQFATHDASKIVEIIRPARRQRLRQLAVADEAGSLCGEGRIAEDMVGMAVGVDDVADRLGCAGPHRRQQRLALTEAAAGVDHGHRILADDKADIGDVAFVLAGHEGGGPGVHENSGATSLTGNSAAPARASVAVPSRDRAAIKEAMRDTFPPQFRWLAALHCNKPKPTQSLAKHGASCVAWLAFKQTEEEAR